MEGSESAPGGTGIGTGPAGKRRRARGKALGALRHTKLGSTQLQFQLTRKDTREYRTWFRGEHTHYNPTRARLLDPDAAGRRVLHGWAPERPVIGPQTQVTAFGSCFALHISDWLSARNFRVLNRRDEAKSAYVVACGEGMVNSFVIRQQFEWAWEDRRFDQPLWHGYRAEDYGYDPPVQAETRRLFDATDVFILTFGLSEVWYDAPTGEVFWRTIPKDVYDPARHRFRVSSVEENRDNLRAIYRLIRRHRPDATIIFSLSPIPLIATFRDRSCLTANSVSKAVLRVAIDEVMREVGDDGVLHYWPSYELVTDVFRSAFEPDRRHPSPDVLDCIMTLFERTWCTGAAPPPPLAPVWARACAAAGLLPPRLSQIILEKRPRLLRHYVAQERLTGDQALDAALRSLGKKVLQAWNAGA